MACARIPCATEQRNCFVVTANSNLKTGNFRVAEQGPTPLSRFFALLPGQRCRAAPENQNPVMGPDAI
jgi:hypothetical protein